MSAHEAFIFVAALAGGLAVFFVIAAVVSDLLVPWVDGLWRARCARPQARYLPRKP